MKTWIAVSVVLLGLSGWGSIARAQGDYDPETYDPEVDSEPATSAATTVGPHRRTEWLYLEAEGGLQSINLQTFTADSHTFTAGLVPTRATGPSVDVGAGFRIFFFTIGSKARVGLVDEWDMWSLDGELGFRFPLDRVEPHLSLYGGYTTLGNLQSAIEGLGRGLDVDGANVGAQLGIDYYLTPWFTLGLNVGGDLLFMSRRGIAVRDLLTAKPVNTLNEAQARVLEGDGSSMGTAWNFGGSVGLHF